MLFMRPALEPDAS